MALSPTEQLVALACADNLKIEGVVKPAAVLGTEEKLYLSLSFSWHNPPMASQSVNTQAEQATQCML